MATIVAAQTGNFSANATWVGGVVPGAGDIAQTGNYTVTIDQSIECTLNPTGSGYFIVNTGGITITGDLVMSSTATGGGLRCTHTTGTVTLTGTATGGVSINANGAYNSGAGTLTVGTATGGVGAYACGAYNNAAGTLTVGTATGGAGSYAHGAYNNAAGTLVCDLAIGSNWGVGGNGGYSHGVYGGNATGQTTKVKRIQFGPYGCVPVGGAVLIEPDASNSAQFRTAFGGATLTLVDAAASADFPAAADVRSGVSYDNGDKVGTCAVPEANDVAYGVPVDNTTGVAVLTAAAVAAAAWDTARSGHATPGTFGATGEWAGSVDEAAIATAAAAAILVTPANKLATDAGGNASANVTLWNGAAVSGAPALEATAQAILEDTGTTLPGLIGTGGVTPQEVWEYAVRTLTQTNGTSTTDSTTAGSIVRRRGDSWSIPLTIGPITGYTSLWFTVKGSRDDLDSAALVQIKLNASAPGDGLLVVNGATASNDALGSITVLDAATGSINVALDETITDDLAPGDGYYYDAQVLVSGTVTTPDSGTFNITADVTRSVA